MPVLSERRHVYGKWPIASHNVEHLGLLSLLDDSTPDTHDECHASLPTQGTPWTGHSTDYLLSKKALQSLHLAVSKWDTGITSRTFHQSFVPQLQRAYSSKRKKTSYFLSMKG